MQHKFELTIKDLVAKILDTDQGVFINVPHDDVTLNLLVSPILSELKDKFKFFFCEQPDTLIQKAISTLKNKIIAGEKKFNSEPSEESRFVFIATMAEKMPALVPIFHASIVYDIPVIGVDVSEAELAELDRIRQSVPDCKEAVKMMKARASHDDAMIKNIREHTKNGEKYIFLGGLTHAKVPTVLGIKKISLFSLQHYLNLKLEFEKNILFKEAGLVGKDQEPDYAYVYTEQDKKVTFKSLSLPLFESQISAAFSEKTSGLFRGIFAKATPPADNIDPEKKALQAKYMLKNTSLSELENGLRIAANNNKFDDIKKFISFGANINSQSALLLKTPLHCAVEKKYAASIEVLLELGSDIDIEDKNGNTVLKLVQDNIEFFKTNAGFEKITKLCEEKFPEEYKKIGCALS